MKISKDSWHYRLNDWVKGDSDTMWYLRNNTRPVSLCWYFWFTVFSCLIAGIGGLFYITGAISAVFLVWALLLNPMISLFALLTGYGYGMAQIEHMYFGLSLGSLLAIVAGLLVWNEGGIKFAPDWMVNLFQRNPKPQPEPKEPEPSLIWEFIKAKKQKICPVIELKKD